MKEFSFMNIGPEERADMVLDVYLLAGQSNANGSTTFGCAKPWERDFNRYENVRYVASSRVTDGSYKYLYERYEAVHEGLGITQKHIGPELGMARFLDPLYDTPNRKAIILKCSEGGVSLFRSEPLREGECSEGSLRRFLERGSWCPTALDRSGSEDYFRPTGFRLRELKKFAAKIWRELESLHYKQINLCGMCWMQGETDAARPEEYAEAFPMFCREVRDFFTELTGTDQSELPIIVGEISETCSDADEAMLARNRAFIAMQNRLPETVPGVTVIHTGHYAVTARNEQGERVELGKDRYHWNYGQMLEIGQMFGQAVYDKSHLIKNITDFSFLRLRAEERSAMDLDLYLLAGQSNGDGTSTFESAGPGQRDFRRYENVRYVGMRRFTDGRYRYRYERFEPVHEGLGFEETRIGPELGMARVLNGLYGGDRRAIIIKSASGGTSLTRHEPADNSQFSKSSVKRFYERGSWYPETLEQPVSDDPFRPTSYLMRQFKQYVTEIYSDLRDLRFRSVTIRALCWMQGEEDRKTADEYAQVFPVFCREVRDFLTELTGTDQSELPIIVGEISETFNNSTPEILELNRRFIAVQDSFADTIPAVTVIPTRDFALTRLDENGELVPLGTDKHHWSYGQMVQIGELFGRAAYEKSQK